MVQTVGVYNEKRRHYYLQMQTPNLTNTQQKHQYLSYKRGLDEWVKC